LSERFPVAGTRKVKRSKRREGKDTVMGKEQTEIFMKIKSWQAAPAGPPPRFVGSYP
jgi:hypothetical protein